MIRLEDQVGEFHVGSRLEPGEKPVGVGRVILQATEVPGGVELVDVKSDIKMQLTAVLGLSRCSPASS
jgi:hypothetical protein